MSVITSNLSSLEIAEDTVIITIENGKKNLLTIPEFIEKDVLDEVLRKHPGVTSLVIRGAGRHFSHGADVSLFDGEESREDQAKKLRKAKELLIYIENLPLITVAAINGGCFGGGLEIALSCQFRVCSKNAFLGLPEINHGVIPGMNGIERLTRAVGKNKAVKMILSGELVNAENAEQMGLADMVSEDKDCFNETLAFISGLKSGKNAVQINNIIRLANSAANGEPIDPDDDSFSRVLDARCSAGDTK